MVCVWVHSAYSPVKRTRYSFKLNQGDFLKINQTGSWLERNKRAKTMATLTRVDSRTELVELVLTGHALALRHDASISCNMHKDNWQADKRR